MLSLLQQAALRGFSLRGGAKNPKVFTLFQVADVDIGVINRIKADLVTHIALRD